MTRAISTALLIDTVTAKGDLIVATAASTVTNIAVGTDATGSGRIPQVLYPDSAVASGLRWGDDYKVLDVMQAI